MQEITNKSFFRNYSFFVVILIVIFGLLIYPVLVSKKSWNTNLKTSVQKVLDEYNPGAWEVIEPIEINKPISSNCAAYTVKSINNKSDKVEAIILRITTFYGPLPAVYLYFPEREIDSVVFAGYSSLHGRVRTQLNNNIIDKRQEYWIKKIPEILN